LDHVFWGRGAGWLRIKLEYDEQGNLLVNSGAGHRGTLALTGVVALVAALVAVAVVTRPSAPTAHVTLGRTAAELAPATSATEDSLEQFWAGRLPAVYKRGFTPLKGGFQPKTPQSPPFSCNGQRQTYDDMKGNAFYCGGPNDDYIAWDAALLMPELDSRFGGIAPAVVLAHEMGHAVQRRAGVSAPSVLLELQADCFAGSWVRYAETSGDDPVALSDGALDSAIATILALRDQPGTPATNVQAHGLGFDRVNSFQTGYEDSAQGCAQLANRGVVTTELPFRTVTEAQTGGNLPFSEAVGFLAGQLDSFWTQALPKMVHGKPFKSPARQPVEQAPLPDCARLDGVDAISGYCPDSRTVMWVVPALQAAHQQVGDMATGAALSEAWGIAAQTEAGLPVTGRGPGLQRDCFTGAWVSALAAGGLEQSLLSPGDIDEVLSMIVATSFSPSGDRVDRGGAFDRTKAFRHGIFEGLPSCH
jgi:predicted metalloprotease